MSTLINEKTASYIIYKEGSIYVAVNGHTGAVTSNPAFSTLMNAVVVACPQYGKISVKDGTYDLASTPVNLKSDITLELGKAVFLWSHVNPDAVTMAFKAVGSIAAGTALSVNAAAGDRQVTTAIDPGLVEGDWTLVESQAQTMTVTGAKDAEMHRVIAVTGTGPYVITFIDPLEIAYTTANTAKIRKITPVTNLTIIGGTIQGDETADVDAVLFFYCTDCTMRDTRFIDTGRVMVYVISCANMLFDNIYGYDSYIPTSSGGIAFCCACTDNRVINSKFYHVSEPISHGDYGPAGMAHGFSRNTNIENCDLHDTSGIDSHKGHGYNMHVTNCRFYIKNGSTCINIGGRKTHISDCIAIQDNDYTEGDNSFIMNRDGADSLVEEVYVDNCYLYNIASAVYLTSPLIKELKVSDVHGKNCFSYFVVITAGTTNTIVSISDSSWKTAVTSADVNSINIEPLAKSVKISNTRIYLAGRTGIYLLGVLMGSITVCEILNPSSGAASTNKGIELENCVNIVISDNHVIDDRGGGVKMVIGIKEIGSSDNNIITDNRVYGAWDVQISKVGAATKVRDNLGFATENGGTATITAAATSIAVNHGCAYTPSALDTSVVLTNLPTNDIGDVYVDTFGAAQFTIHCRNVPGVSTAIFNWNIHKTP